MMFITFKNDKLFKYVSGSEECTKKWELLNRKFYNQQPTLPNWIKVEQITNKGDFLANEIVKNIKPEFEDERGFIANILEEHINHVALITSKKGSIRGNHYHPDQVQYVYLVSGKYESMSKNLKDKNAKVETKIIESGSLVITPPMTAHAMRFLEDSILLNLTTGHRDSNKFSEHTKKYKLI